MVKGLARETSYHLVQGTQMTQCVSVVRVSPRNGCGKAVAVLDRDVGNVMPVLAT